MMKRVTLAVSAGVMLGQFFAAPAYVSAAEVDGPEVKWDISLWGNRRAVTEGMEYVVQKVNEVTDGKFDITLQYGSVLSGPKENIDGLQIGAFEGAKVCSVYHPGKTPVLSGLDMPFLFSGLTMPQRAKIYMAYYEHPAAVAEFERWNMVPLMPVVYPSYEVMGRGDAPETLEDWKGLRMHASGGVGELIAGIGVVPTSIGPEEIFQALERGVIDGAVYPYTYAFVAYRLHEVSNWVTDNWSLGAVHCTFALQRDAYEALPDQYKALLKDVVPAALEHQFETYKKVDAENEVLFKGVGIKKIALTPEIEEELKGKGGTDNWNAWIKSSEEKGLPGQELFDTLQDLVNKEKN